jgi:signal transduction histidine kinase
VSVITEQKSTQNPERKSEVKESRRTFSEDEIDQIVEEHNEGNVSKEINKLMKQYEDETGKYAVWRGQITEGFKTYLMGGKINDRDKERISLYVSETTKDKWQQFIKEESYSTISKLIRESVNYYIDEQTSAITNGNFRMNIEAISNISHALKEPLTTIKGFSQLLLENNKDELRPEVLSKIENIFEQSLLLETKIKNILDDITVEGSKYDILLIEDDLATIRLLFSRSN